MSMDAQLAEIYGTGQEANAEDDQVKLAAAELLVKLAGDNNVDLSQFSDAEVAEMVQELQKEAELPPQFQKKEESSEEKKETPESKESSESSSESPEAKKAEAAEKVAEADFLGRVMAHSFAQECKEIEKDAGEEKPSGGKWSRAIGRATTHGLVGQAAGAGVGAGVGAALGKALKHGAGKGAGAGALVGAGLGSIAGQIHGARKGWREGKATDKALHEKKGEAEQSALNALAEQRALAMAKEAGWVDTEGNLVAPPAPEATKTASPLDLAVERRALEMLEANGYPVTWNE